MRTLTTGVLAILIALASPFAAAQTIAVTGGRVMTAGPEGELDSATIIIRDGVIVSVGSDARIPDGAKVVDAKGKIVAPGFVSPVSGVGLSDLMEEMAEMMPGGQAGAANDILLAFNPNNPNVRANLMEGVTSAVIAPALSPTSAQAGQPFAGRAAAVELSGSMDFVIRENVANVIDVTKAGSLGRAGFLPLVRQQLAAARRQLAEGRVDSASAAAALEPVLKGERLLLVDVERASDILNVLRMAREEKIRIALVGASEGWLVSDQIAQAQVPVIIVGDLNYPETLAQLHATYQNAQRLAEAGVEIAILPQSNMPAPRNPGPLRYAAGRTVRFGLDYQTAIRAITSTPARIFGIDDQVGSIAPGRRADIVVWSGDPLEVSSFPELVLVRGVEVPLVSRETLIRDRYATPRR